MSEAQREWLESEELTADELLWLEQCEENCYGG